MIWYLVLAMAILTGLLVSEYTPNKNTKAELMALQDEYLETRDASVLGQMWTRLNAMAQGHVRKIVRKARRTPSEHDIECRAADAANYIIEQYLTRPDFQITESFDSYLRSRVLAEMHGSRQKTRDTREVPLEHDELDQIPAHGCEDADPGGIRDEVISAVFARVDSVDRRGYRDLLSMWFGGSTARDLRAEATRLGLCYSTHVEQRKAAKHIILSAGDRYRPPAITA